MRRSYLAFAVFVLLSVSPAFGQYVRVIEACTRDVTDSCALTQPGRGPLMETFVDAWRIVWVHQHSNETPGRNQFAR